MNQESQQASGEKQDIHFLDYLIVLAKHGRMIIYTTLTVMAVTYLYLFIQPHVYTGIARFLPPQQSLTMSGQILESVRMSGGVGTTAAGGLGSLSAFLGLRTPGELYVGMMTSDSVLDAVIQRFNLKERHRIKRTDDARLFLKGTIKVASEKSGIITVRATDRDPKQAAALANAFVEELDVLLSSMAQREAKGQLSFLERERSQASLKLAEAEEAFRVFSEKSGAIQMDAQTRGMLQYVASLRASIDSKEIEIQVLRQRATPMNDEVIRLDTELKGLKEKLREAECQPAQNPVGEVCLPTSRVPALGLEYFRLYREAKYQEALYQLYCKLMELARLEVARDVPRIPVVDQARPPEKRSNKRVFPSLVVGAITFIIMVIAAFGREYWATYGHTENNARRLTQLRFYLERFTEDFRRLRFWRSKKG